MTMDKDNEHVLSYGRLFDKKLSSNERISILAYHLDMAIKMMEKCLEKRPKLKAGTLYKWRRYASLDSLTDPVRDKVVGENECTK